MALKGMSVTWLLAVALVVSNGVASEIDSPPRVGDRFVELSWQPDFDDPIFDGNTILEVETVWSFIHSPGNPVLSILPIVGSIEVYSYAVGENSIKRWDRSTGEVVQELQKGSAGDINALTVHTSGRVVAAAHETGEIEIWDVDEPGTSQFFPIADEPLSFLQFFPSVVDPEELRFVAAADSFLYVMAGPEEQTFKILSVAGPVLASAISRSGTRVAGGAENGTTRLWDLNGDPEQQGPFTSNRAEPQPGAVRQFVFSRDGARLVSVDDTGNVRISRVQNQPNLEFQASFDVPSLGEGPKVAFSVPTGSVLIVTREDGIVQIHDGHTGAFLREARFSDSNLTTVAATLDGQRSLFGTDNGEIVVGRAERCTPSLLNPVCFGGYKLWRNVLPDTAGVVLIRSFAFGDSTWAFAGEVRSFRDPDSILVRVSPPGNQNTPPPDPDFVVAGPHNGVSYFYSLTRFNRVFHEGSVFDVLLNSVMDGFYRDPGDDEPTAIVPQSTGRDQVPLLGEVVPVPNPYEAGSVPWDAIGGEHIEFRNLPASASIRIYTTAGDIVRVLEHGPGRYGESRSAAIWDLRNSQGRRVASGVYFYQVESETGEIVQGFCTIIL